jgi:hypothetical protein
MYMALGHRGQYIVVVPEKEMVVAFTSDLADDSFKFPRQMVDSFIVAAAESLTPLPVNPDGVARLQTLIQEAAAQPKVTPQPVPPPPAIAELVLGETYILEENVLGLESFSLVRQEAGEAWLHLTLDGTVSFTEGEYRIGLDGIQRLATGIYGMPAASTGNWEGESTFIAEIEETSILVNWRLELEFQNDQVTATVPGSFPETHVIQGKRVGSP